MSMQSFARWALGSMALAEGITGALGAGVVLAKVAEGNLKGRWRALPMIVGLVLSVAARQSDPRRTRLAMAGVPVTAIRDLAGHSSVAITNDYMHLAPAAGVSAIDVLSAFHDRATGATSIVERGRRRDAAPKKN